MNSLDGRRQDSFSCWHSPREESEAGGGGSAQVPDDEQSSSELLEDAEEAEQLYSAINETERGARLQLPRPPTGDSRPTLMSLPIQIISKSICPYLTIPDLWALSAVNSHARVLLRNFPEILSSSDYCYVNSVSAGDVTVKGTRVWYRDEDQREDRCAVDLGHHLCVKQAVRGGVPTELRIRLYFHVMKHSDDFQDSVLSEIRSRSSRDFSLPLDVFASQWRTQRTDRRCHFADRMAAILEVECERAAPEELTLLKSSLDAIKITRPHHFLEHDMVYHYITRYGTANTTSLGELIDRDLDRTFPNHPLFRGEPGTLIKKAMRDILVAVAVVEPSLGYCQGMNFVAGALICELLCPEAAFWTMLFLLRRRSLIGLFSPGISAMSTKIMQLKEIIRLYTPETYMSYKRAGVSLEVLCHQSLLTSLTYFLHPTIVIHFWDAVILGGSRVLMVVTLSIVCLVEQRALRRDSDDAWGRRSSSKSHRQSTDGDDEQQGDTENREPQRHRIFEPLQQVQEERLRISHLYRGCEEGEQQFKELVDMFLKYYSRCTSQLLSRLSSISLVTMLRDMVNELHNALKFSASTLSRDSSIVSAKRPPISSISETRLPGDDAGSTALIGEGLITPPYLLVPKLPKFNPSGDDSYTPRGMLVHFISSRDSARSFRFSRQTLQEPRNSVCRAPSAAGEASNVRREPSGAQDAFNSVGGRLQWSLLIPEQERVNASELRLVHGGGRLKASSFFVILDARYFLNEERVPSLCADDVGLSDQDALTDYLMRKKTRAPQVDEVGKISLQDLRTYLKEVDQAAAQETVSMRRCGNSQSSNLVVLKSEANLLLDWLKTHDVSPDAASLTARGKAGYWSAASYCEQEGFVIIPLKVIITLIHAFREKRKQFMRDREHFEAKVTVMDRQINQSIRQIDRLRQRHSQQIKIVSQLEEDLYEQLHRTPKPSYRTTVWKKLLTWRGSMSKKPAGGEPETMELTHSPEVEQSAPRHSAPSVNDLAPPASPNESRCDQSLIDPGSRVDAVTDRPCNSSQFELSPTLSVAKTDFGYPPKNRHQSTIGRTYEKQRAKLEDLADKLASCEELLTEQISVKSTLSQTYHEIETVQMLEELDVVENLMYNCCSWRKGSSVPYAVLMQAGIIQEEDPTTMSPQISLPPIVPQLKSIFRL